MEMSREEAISLLTQINKILVNSNSWLENTHEPLNMAFDMAIKALEQESILNKIRAEVIAESYPEDEESSFCKIVYLKDVLDIIDKYKAKSEG